MKAVISACMVGVMLAAGQVMAADLAVGPRASGDLSDVLAWVGHNTVGGPNLIITGNIEAPSECYRVETTRGPDEKIDPPNIILNVDLKRVPGLCRKAPTQMAFRYKETAFNDNHAHARVVSATSTLTVEIGHAY